MATPTGNIGGPNDAIRQLRELLEATPEWARFPPRLEDWTDEQILSRFPLAYFARGHLGRGTVSFHSVWAVFQQGYFAIKIPGTRTTAFVGRGTQTDEARPFVTALEQREATEQPDPEIYEELRRAWSSYTYQLHVRPQIVQNAWAERQACVAETWNLAMALAPTVRRGVTRLGRDPGPLDGILEDRWLYDDTVDRALAVLGDPPSTQPSQLGSGSQRETGASTQKDELELNAAEKAFGLLIRDLDHPRSVRAYAADVGVSHTTLYRNAAWMAAWKAAKEKRGSIRSGHKDADGSIHAISEDRCENCYEANAEQTVVVDRENLRLCAQCAKTV